MSILRRVSLKLSTDLSDEEIRKAIAQTMGIPLEEVPIIDFVSAKAKIKEEIHKVENIIFLSARGLAGCKLCP